MAECVATSTHTVWLENSTGVVNYEWSVTSNAYIVSGQGTKTVTIGTTDDAFVSFDLTVLVTDDKSNSIYTDTFTHERIPEDLSNEDTFYIMNVPLVLNEIPDAALGDTASHGTLHLSTDAEWVPTSTEYPEDGTILLQDGKYIEIPHTFPSSVQWQFIRCYNVSGRNFKIMVIVYHGNGTADFLYGDQDTYPTLLSQDTGVGYVPIYDNYKITELLDVPATEITYEMDAFIEDAEITYEMDEFNVTGGGGVFFENTFDANVTGTSAIDDVTISWQSPGLWRTVNNTTSIGRSEYIVSGLTIGVEYVADGAVAYFSGGIYAGLNVMLPNAGTYYGSITVGATYNAPIVFTAESTQIAFMVDTGTTDYSTLDVDWISLNIN